MLTQLQSEDKEVPLQGKIQKVKFHHTLLWMLMDSWGCNFGRYFHHWYQTFKLPWNNGGLFNQTVHHTSFSQESTEVHACAINFDNPGEIEDNPKRFEQARRDISTADHLCWVFFSEAEIPSKWNETLKCRICKRRPPSSYPFYKKCQRIPQRGPKIHSCWNCW